MSFNPSCTRTRRLARALLAGAAGLALAMPGWASEADPIEEPLLRAPAEQATGDDEALTRAEVRDALHSAVADGRHTPPGEIGDTPEVLQAREEFNALQREALEAEQEFSQEMESQDTMLIAPPIE